MAGASSIEIAANQKSLQLAARNLAAVLRAAGVGSERGLQIIGVKITAELKTILSAPGAGARYGRHVASAPGEPPAVDTGRLRASYRHAVIHEGMSPVLLVGTNVEYASFLEFGTSKMEARPHLRPAVARAGAFVPAIVAMEIAKAQRQAVGALRGAVGGFGGGLGAII